MPRHNCGPAPVAAANPSRAPQLKVSPNQACGHQVIRFMNG